MGIFTCGKNTPASLLFLEIFGNLLPRLWWNPFTDCLSSRSICRIPVVSSADYVRSDNIPKLYVFPNLGKASAVWRKGNEIPFRLSICGTYIDSCEFYIKKCTEILFRYSNALEQKLVHRTEKEMTYYG